MGHSTKRQSARIAFTRPCLAVAVAEPPLGADWVHEIKFDGYRVQAMVDESGVRLLTRNGLDWTHRFLSIVGDVAALAAKRVVLDCEAVALDEVGRSDFSLLQAEIDGKSTASIRLMAFDLLHVDGRDCRAETLVRRKAKLEALLGRSIQRNGRLHFVEHVVGDGRRIFDSCCEMGLEGIVSKRTDGPYRSGRNGDWTKSKCSNADPFVVAGYAPSQTGADLVGSLVLGFYDDGGLVYAGRVGSGFSLSEAHAMHCGFEAIRRSTPPFAQGLTRQQCKDVVWLAPVLIAQVRYRSVTRDGLLRQASFTHFREDKRPEQIHRPKTLVRFGER